MFKFLLAACIAIQVAVLGIAPSLALDTNAPYAIVIHAESGRIVFSKNHNEPFPPASMSKIVTAGVVFDKLKSGEISLDDEYRVSDFAWRTGGAPARGSTMFAAVRSNIRVEDLLRGLIIHSGNDSAIILAEGISGSVEAFTEEMAAYAQRAGAENSSFANAHGLHDDNHFMSAYDLAMVARHIILNHPEYYGLFAEESFTWNNIFQRNRNPLLGRLRGVDGLKTGFTSQSGFGLVTSAKRGDVRLIVVLGGLRDDRERADETEQLLEWAFASFTSRLLASGGAVVAEARVVDGETTKVPLVIEHNISPLMRRDSRERVWGRVFYDGPLRAPIAANTQVGMLHVYAGNEKLEEVPVFTAKDVARGDLYDRVIGGVVEMFYGLIPTVDLASITRRGGRDG